MQYWMAITNEDNWQVIKEKKIWGVSKSHSNSISRTEIGDKLLIYCVEEIRKGNRIPSRVTASYEIISEPEKESTIIFKNPYRRKEIFPWRVNLKLIGISDPPVKFKLLIKELQFIKNKNFWSAHLQTAMRTIPKEDYETIIKNFKKK